MGDSPIQEGTECDREARNVTERAINGYPLSEVSEREVGWIREAVGERRKGALV